MIQDLEITIKNHYKYVDVPSKLNAITSEHLNIVILKRDLDNELATYTKQLMEDGFAGLRTSFNVKDFDAVFDDYFKTISGSYGYALLKDDIRGLITEFSSICNNSNLSLFFGVVDTNMCSRFHTDVYELRMISSYCGQGTQWLTEDNVNFDALTSLKGNEDIVYREDDIQQLGEQDVAIMKGELYPNSKVSGVVHKSPAIESQKLKRLMLRVDSNSLLDSIN